MIKPLCLTVFMLFQILLCGCFNHDISYTDQTQEAPTFSIQMKNKIVADDLSKSVTLLMDQISSQIKISSQSFNHDNELNETLVYKEYTRLNQLYPSIDSLAVIENNNVIASTDGFQNSNSDDYVLLTEKINNQQLLACQIDRTEIMRFIIDLAPSADINGHLTLPPNQLKAYFNAHKSDENNKVIVNQQIPELNSTIYLESIQALINDKDHIRNGEVLVKFKTESALEKWIVNNNGCEIVKKNSLFAVLRSTELTSDQLASQLIKNKMIQYVEPNYIYEKQTASNDNNHPNDELYHQYQWNLSQISAADGWNYSEGSEDVIIAILDTGIATRHIDLATKIVEGYNAFDETNNVEDYNGHGTHVAGISSAMTDNLSGIAGVSWYSKLMPVKVLNDDGEGSLYEVASGIRWAVDHGAKIINMSLGDHQDSQIMRDAIEYAYKNDVVIIAAAGNENVSTPMYPSAYEQVLAVSAVTANNQKAPFSNYGEHIDVAAPGEHIPSTYLNNQYVYMSGTSMATPHVSGLAGLIRSIQPELSNEQVMDLIRHTSNDIGSIGRDHYFGYGQINVGNALSTISNHDILNEEDEQTSPLTDFYEWVKYFLGKRKNIHNSTQVI